MATKVNGIIFKVAGPLVVADNMGGSRMFEVVQVGKQRLVGEIIRSVGCQSLKGIFFGNKSPLRTDI